MSKDNLSLKAFCEMFWAFEAHHDLLNLKIQGVYVWQSCRLEIYYKLAHALNILEPPSKTSAKQNINLKLASTAKRISSIRRDALLRSFWNRLKPRNHSKKIGIIEHNRSVNFNGEYTDIYSHDLINSLQNKSTPFVSFSARSATTQKSPKPYRYSVDLINTITELFGIKPSPPPELKQLGNQINQHFEVNISLDRFLSKKIRQFKCEYALYKQTFKAFNISKLYVVVAYYQCAALSAAKDLSIETCELQHGTYSPYHLGYSYPYAKPYKNYIPERFKAWNEFWKQQFDELNSPMDCQSFSFRYLYEQLDLYKSQAKKNNKLIVLSQGALSEKLAAVVLENISKLTDFEIMYKLHPAEFGHWQSNPYLAKLSAYANVKVIEQCELYQELAEASYVLGVFSTAIFEAMELKCQPVLIELPGIEYMENVLKSGKAVTLSNFLAEHGH